MQTRFFWKTSGLFAVMLATATATAQADDKPATPKKPTVTAVEVVLQAQPGKAATAKKPAVIRNVVADVRSLAISADFDTLLVSGAPETRKLGVAVTAADPVLRANVPATKGKLGLVVTSVVKDSPAGKAKIRPNDILLTLGSKELAAVSDLTAAVRTVKSPVKVIFVRAGATMEARVQFPPQTKGARSVELVARFPGQSKYTIGVSTKAADTTLAAQLVLPPSTGRVIVHVSKDYPAAKAGLQRHDVILTINDQYITSEAGLGNALDKAAGKPVKIEFLRAGRKQSCLVTATKRPPVHGVVLWNLQSGRLLSKPVGAHLRFYRNLSDIELYSARSSGNIQVRRLTTPDLNAQVDRLSKQVDELKKTLDALKKQLPVRKTTIKKTKSK